MKTENRSKFDNFLWFSFLLLVFSAALMQPFFNYTNLRFSSTDFVFPFVFLLFIISILFRFKRFRWHQFYWFLLFYFLSMLISAFFSTNPKQSFVKLTGELYLLILPILTINLVMNSERLKKFLEIWLYGTILTIFVGIFSLLLFYIQKDNWLLTYTTYGFGAVPVGNYPRLASTFISASMFCNYLNVSLCFLFAAKILQIFRPVVFWILLISLTICAIFTISAGLGGIFLAFSIWIWILCKENNKSFARLSLFGGITVSILFLLVNFIALQPHPTAPFTFNLLGQTFYPSSRLMIWTDVFKTISNNFVNGVGLGQEVCRVIFENTNGSKAYLTDAHNIFLSVFAQNGIFGFLSFSVLIFYIIKTNFFHLDFGNKKTSDIFYLIAAAFVCSFLYQGLTGSFEDARHLWISVGFIFSAKAVLQTT